MISSIYYRDLTGEYQKSFMDVYFYMQSSNIKQSTLNNIIEEVGDMLLSAQRESLPAKNVVGSDIEGFCKEILSASIDKRDRVLQSLIKV